jgi:hypothetical protein
MKHLTIALLCVSTVASAKPLPDGMKVTLVKKRLMVSKDGLSVPLEDSKLPNDKLISAELSADGKTIVVKRARCDGMFDSSEDGDTFPLAAAEARLENTAGMKLHTKKKYAEAAKHFAIAAQKDPATPLYATNLLSAQAMGKMFDDADKTIATYGKSQIPWFAWRLAVDPELKALKGRPAAKLGPAARGKAKGSLRDKLAYSPLGLVATEVLVGLYDGDGDPGPLPSDLVIAAIGSDAELLRLSTSGKAGRKAADALLAELGFDLVPGGLTNVLGGDTVTAADGRKLVEGSKVVMPKGATIDLSDKIDMRVVDAAFVPKAVVLVQSDKQLEECDGMGSYRFWLTAVATP